MKSDIWIVAWVCIVDSYSGFVFRIRIQDSYPGFVSRVRFRIRIQDSYSGFVFRIRIQDSYPGFVFRIRVLRTNPSECESCFPILND